MSDYELGSTLDTSLPPVGSDVVNLANQNVPLGDSGNFLEYRHKEYHHWAQRWQYADDHYSGSLLDPQRIPFYLIKRQIGESIDSWEERVRLVDFTNHFACVVDSLCGVMLAKEDEANRKYSDDPDHPEDGLGQPDDPTTVIGRLWLDADGQGTGLPTLLANTAVQFCVTHKVWGLVDSPLGDARVQMLHPQCVKNWVYDKQDGGLSEVLVEVDVDTRTSVKDKANDMKEYILYTRTGWQRYQTVQGKPVQMTGDGNEGTYHFEDRSGRTVLPVFCVDMPLKRPVGWLLARKQNTIMNLESGRDFLLWIANFPKMFVAAGDELYLKIVNALRQGVNAIQEDPSSTKQHRYDAPPTSSVTAATEVLKRKVEEYYVTAFREYGNSARMRTATEVKQDAASGVGAFLQMLKAAMDDFENSCYARIEQIEFPDKPQKWFKAQVSRSTDFAPTDVSDMVEKMSSRYFQKASPVPVGRSAQIAAAKQIAMWEGLEVDEDEIAAQVDISTLQALWQILPDFELPPEAKSRLALKLLQATGIVKDTDDNNPDAPEDESLKLDAKDIINKIEETEQAKVDEKQAFNQFAASAPKAGGNNAAPFGGKNGNQNASPTGPSYPKGPA